MFDLAIRSLGRIHRLAETAVMKAELAYRGRNAEIEGLKVTLPRRVLSDKMAFGFLRGGGDGEDRRLISRYVRSGDNLLNLGGGSGLTAMFAYRQVGAQGLVTMVEPDPLMHDLARSNFQENGMDAIRSRCAAAVMDRSEKTVTFYKKRNYHGSSLRPMRDARPITVEAVYPLDLVENGHAGRKVLICDIEYYETKLLSIPEFVRPFEVMMVEFHFHMAPKNETSPYAGMFRCLFDSGFRIADIDDSVFVFVKD